MPTIGQIIRRVLPHGTQPRDAEVDPESTDWSSPPSWPPDAFALAATLVRLSECYAHPAVRGGIGLGGHAARSQRLGRLWSRLGGTNLAALQRGLSRSWNTLLRHRATPVVLNSGEALPDWARAAIELLAVSDEACADIGFGGSSSVALLAERVALHNRSTTLTLAADPMECCVQPKARTPAVGCNLRSLTNHLALLPGAGQVDTRHYSLPRPLLGNQLGLLIVPFPYVLGASDFSGRPSGQKGWGHLGVSGRWLKTTSPAALTRLVLELISAAEAQGRSTELVVLPELALSPEHFSALASALQRLKAPRMLVAGMVGTGRGVGRNFVKAAMLGLGSRKEWEQSKHHRWKVEKWQIKNYGLGLDPAFNWWEDIDVTHRRVVVTRFHDSASIATLVCEDLARIEPVQPVIREMGPSLVLALLMDGPQLSRRWPGTYASVLAEDPGSSVLSLTSLGLVRRYRKFREEGRGDSHAVVALWKDRTGQARELALGPNQHALHLRLDLKARTELTLDGRSDGGTSRSLTLRDVVPLRSAWAPDWAKPFYATGAA